MSGSFSGHCPWSADFALVPPVRPAPQISPRGGWGVRAASPYVRDCPTADGPGINSLPCGTALFSQTNDQEETGRLPLQRRPFHCRPDTGCMKEGGQVERARGDEHRGAKPGPAAALRFSADRVRPSRRAVVSMMDLRGHRSDGRHRSAPRGAEAEHLIVCIRGTERPN